MTTKQPTDSACPSIAIVEKVAALEGTDLTELPPLYEVVDPEALDELVESADPESADFEVEFPYCGHEVTVSTDGEIDIEKATPEQAVA